jgi:spore coat polysaccharide biosynthesis protein SpsF
MTVACIIQARLGSTRLPAKVLLPLPTGRTVLEEVIHRCKQIEGVDFVLCAMPDTAENNPVVKYAIAGLSGHAKGWCFALGSEHDVLARVHKAVSLFDADVIMRITADCPLLNPEVCAEVLRLRERTGAGYASNAWPVRSYPHGWDCEVFTREVLEKAHREATDAYDREHVCPYMQRDESVKKAFLKNIEDRGDERLTLDTLADYTRIWNVLNDAREHQFAA